MKRPALLASILLGLAFPCLAQAPDASDKDPIVLGLGGGAINYSGDLGGGHLGAGFGASLMFRSLKRNHLSINVGYGSIGGQDADFEVRDAQGLLVPVNKQFTSSLVYGFVRYDFRLWAYRNLKLFFSPGLGFIRFEPQDQQGEPLADNLSTRAVGETYGTISPIVPTLLHVSYALPRSVELALFLGWWNPATDYLDNIGDLGGDNGSDQLFVVQGQVRFPIPIR